MKGNAGVFTVGALTSVRIMAGYLYLCVECVPLAFGLKSGGIKQGNNKKKR